MYFVFSNFLTKYYVSEAGPASVFRQGKLFEVNEKGQVIAIFDSTVDEVTRLWNIKLSIFLTSCTDEEYSRLRNVKAASRALRPPSQCVAGTFSGLKQPWRETNHFSFLSFPFLSFLFLSFPFLWRNSPTRASAASLWRFLDLSLSLSLSHTHTHTHTAGRTKLTTYFHTTPRLKINGAAGAILCMSSRHA
jgi:hypothetical protein